MPRPIASKGQIELKTWPMYVRTSPGAIDRLMVVPPFINFLQQLPAECGFGCADYHWSGKDAKANCQQGPNRVKHLPNIAKYIGWNDT